MYFNERRCDFPLLDVNLREANAHDLEVISRELAGQIVDSYAQWKDDPRFRMWMTDERFRYTIPKTDRRRFGKR